MAGKGGGGAWKVAYADFVTAMMAFFLVMWITSQDQKYKEAVSHYFMDPMGFHPIGQSKNPGKAGAIFESVSRGDVPKGKEVANGKGRTSYSPGREFSYATKLVGDALAADAALQDHWNASAVKAMTKAQALPQREGDPHTPDDKAAFLLARQMADEAVAAIPQEMSGLHRELLMSAITEVNWQELAEDVIDSVSLPPPAAPRAAGGLPEYR